MRDNNGQLVDNVKPSLKIGQQIAAVFKGWRMRLTKDIIHYQLSLTYRVKHASKADTSLSFGYPVVYSDGVDMAGSAVVCHVEELHNVISALLDKRDTIIVCVGGFPKRIKSAGIPVIALADEVTLVEVFNRLRGIFDLFDRLDDALASAVLEARSFSSLINCCDLVIKSPLAIIDKTGRFVSYNDSYYKRIILPEKQENVETIPWKYASDFTLRKDFPELANRKEATRYTFSQENLDVIRKSIFSNGEFVGGIGAVLEEGMDEGYLVSIMDHLHYYAEQLYDRFKSFGHTSKERSNVINLFEDLLEGKGSAPELWEKALEEIGWEKGSELRLVQLRTNPRFEHKTLSSSLSLEIEHMWSGVIGYDDENRNLLLVNLDAFQSRDNKDFYQAFALFLRENLLIAGLSRTITGLADIRAAYQQTEVAIEIGAEKAPELWYYEFDDFALSYLIKSSSGIFSKEHVCSSKLLMLRDYDTEKSTEYYQTLLTYLKCFFNATEAARRLFIQRSTLLYRLERIEKLAGIDLASFEEVQYLIITFGLLEDTS